MFEERTGTELEVGMGDGAANATHVGGDWQNIDRRMRRIAKRRAALDAEEARLLVEARRAEVHKHLGLGSFVEYLERILGYAPNTARDRIRVAEQIEQLPATTRALATGSLSFSAVRELTRFVTADTEDEWLAYVEGLTVREIEHHARGRKPGDRPGDRPDPDLGPRTLRMELPPATYALFIDARRHLEREVGHSMTDAEFMAVACRNVLGGGPANENGEDNSAKNNQPPHQIAIIVCQECERGWHDVPGQSIEISPSAIERVRCDAVELGRVDDGAASPPKATRTVPANTRRAVLARDHHRCAVPGCTASRFVDVHHILARALGGDDRPVNLITLCEAHHSAHHDGRITIAGEPGRLRVTYPDGRAYGVIDSDADWITAP